MPCAFGKAVRNSGTGTVEERQRRRKSKLYQLFNPESFRDKLSNLQQPTIRNPKQYYLTPCINFCSHFDKPNRITAATPEIITKSIKKSYMVAISNPINDFGLPASGYKPLSIPANLLAVAMDKYQIPISNEAKRMGASLLTIERPIGESISSPME